MHWSMLTRIGVVPFVLALLQVQEAPPDLRKAGEQAYLFAYPLVLMEMTREATERATSNTFSHLTQFPDDKYRLVVSPSVDTLYSGAWLDLSKEPVLLHVPDTRGRYYIMQLVDAWMENVAAPGKRTTGTGEGWFAIVGPRWNGRLPDRARRIDCPTNMAWLVGRTQTNTAADYSNVHVLQRQYWLVPLSSYPVQPGTVPRSDARPPTSNPVPPPRAVAEMSTEQFFTLFVKLLTENPPHVADAPTVKQLMALGIEAGRPFPVDRLGREFEQGVTTAKSMPENSAKLAAAGQLAKTGRTGWALPSALGRYGVEYVKRAVVARIGFVINDPDDAVALGCAQDATGARLNGERKYLMHFEKAQLPPVQAFWSVTMYDEGGYLTANRLNRYALGDRDRLKYNTDGSLDFFIQHDSPEPEWGSNWLPAPAGSFRLTFRLYWPNEAVLKGEWVPPAVTLR